MTFTESRQSLYTAIYLFGGGEAIISAKSHLEAAGFRLAGSGGHGLVLANVLVSDLPSVEAIAVDHSLDLEVFGEREVTTREAAPKPFKLNLEPGKWYWADNLEDSTPLIYVKDVTVQADAQMLTLEYLAPNGMPIPATVDSREVVEYGFRPAIVEDFERYDLVAPDHTYLVPKMAKVEEVATAKPKSANMENFMKRQKKIIATREEELTKEIEFLFDYIEGTEEELGYAIEEGTQEDVDRLEDDILDAEEELALLEEDREALVADLVMKERGYH